MPDRDAQLRSPGDASPQNSRDKRDAFLHCSRDASHSTKPAAPTARLIDMPWSSHEPPGPIGIDACEDGGDGVAPPSIFYAVTHTRAYLHGSLFTQHWRLLTVPNYSCSFTTRFSLVKFSTTSK